MEVDKVISKYAIDLQPVYKSFSIVVRDLLASILKANHIIPNSITNREKAPSSLKEKILRITKNYEDPLSEITDLAGIRIITYFEEDVDKIVPLIEKEFKVDDKNSIDKRKKADPSTFGYASVHLIVELNEKRCELQEYHAFKGLRCEIQVRTILQHAWAEIEHDIVYKSSEEIPFELRRRFASLAGLLEVADREFEQLRKAEIKVRTEIEKTIQNEDFEVPINRDSLTLYLRKVENNGLLNSRDAKKDINNSSRISVLIRMLNSLNIETIQQLHKLLNDEVMESATKELAELKVKCKRAEQCQLKYVIAIGNASGLDKKEISKYARCPEIDKVYDPERYERRISGRLSNDDRKNGIPPKRDPKK